MEATGRLEVVELPGEIEGEVEEIISEWVGDSEKAVMAMLAVQDRYNWLPPEALRCVSRRLNVPSAHLYHIATFYKFFSLRPRGKHVFKLCTGTSCHILRAPLVANALERQGLRMNGTTEDGLFTLEPVNCIGACSMGPVLEVDGKYHGEVSQEGAAAIVRRLLRRLAQKGVDSD